MSTRKPAKPLPRTREGAMHLRVGMLFDSDGPGVHLRAEVAELLCVTGGDYVQIDCEAHGTSIIRELCTCGRVRHAKTTFAYLDPDSVGYLCINDKETVVVSKSMLNLDVP